ncbi:MAG: WD40/YVTN/BNR-like repeat-containing protein [Bacillota bacterium]
MKSKFRIESWVVIGFLFLCSALGPAASGGFSQTAKDSAEAKNRMRQFEKYQAARARSPFKNLKWTAVGPMRPSGRMVDVEVHPSQPEVVYAAAAQGGVWKSTDDGVTWTGIFEDYPTASIGDLAIAPSNPKIVWVGTGEANIFRSSMAGIGIFKSIDAGQHFTYMGLGDTQHIGRILVHPTNPDIVYVAAPGHEYTFNPERGIYKTTNGGKTWQKIFYKNEKTGVIDQDCLNKLKLHFNYVCSLLATVAFNDVEFNFLAFF